MVKCCCYTDLSNFPASATSVNFEYTVDAGGAGNSSNTSNSGGAALSSASNVNIGTNLMTDHTASVTHISISNSSNNNNNNNNNSNNKMSTTKHVKLEKVHLVSFDLLLSF